jgi:aspartate kinase
MAVVIKFGGTSVVKKHECAKIVRALKQPVVVVSALDGVTEILDELSAAAAAQNRPVVHRHLARMRELHADPLLDELERIIQGILALGELTPRSRDMILSFGERLAAPMMAREIGPDAVALTGREAGIVTDENFGEARPLLELSMFQIRETLKPLIDSGKIPVVTGFIAATQHGAITTLGRGGSDYTASLIGAALRADEVIISSDVDGLMTADPRLVPDARTLASVGFAEAIEMVQFGAKAMHPRAIEPAAEHKVPVRIRNTFNSACAGTLITDGVAPASGVARSINLVKNVAMVNITGAAMVGRPGTAARIFTALADAGVNIFLISQSVSESSISLVVASRHLEKAQAALEGALVRPGIARSIGVNPDVCVVAVVGAGMAGTSGVAAKVFGAVAKRGINVMAIAQGSSELSISFVVKGNAGPEAVRGLHAEFNPR